MLLETLVAVRDIGRLHDIATVMIRYGFGDVVQRLGLAGVLEKANRLLRWDTAEALLQLDAPTRVRRALEDLGPTFVKLGQVLATRVDLFPPEWIAAFGELQNDVPALPYEQIVQQLSEDLGGDPERVFARFERTPVAAASLAQAHRAWLADGSAVIVKVRRPGIQAVVDADLRLMVRLAEAVQARAPDLARYRPREVVAQFAASLKRELDFAAECRNAERIAANFAGHPEILIPRVHWQWTGERVNVQDFIDGIPGRDLAAVEAAGLDRATLARIGAQTILKMVLEDGFFHADPHPGNIFYLRDGRIGLIDFGMVGVLATQRRYQVARLLHGLAAYDVESVSDTLMEWAGDVEVDEARLQADSENFISQYRNVPLGQLSLGRMLSDVTVILRQHGLMLPPDLALLIKTFVTLEGMGRALDPAFNMAAEAQPFLGKVLWEHYAPSALLRRGRSTLLRTMDLLHDLPRELRRLLRNTAGGKLRTQVDVPELRPFGDQINRAANRLTMGLITSALIIGSSIVMTSRSGTPSRGVSTLGLLGFIGAALCGIWILFSIWRSGRHK